MEHLRQGGSLLPSVRGEGLGQKICLMAQNSTVSSTVCGNTCLLATLLMVEELASWGLGWNIEGLGLRALGWHRSTLNIRHCLHGWRSYLPSYLRAPTVKQALGVP